jgi:hypothetical protein
MNEAKDTILGEFAVNGEMPKQAKPERLISWHPLDFFRF